MTNNRCVLGLAAVLAVTAPAFAQAPQPAQAAAARPAPARRPPLFFKEEWKQNEKNDEHPATAASVGNPNLQMTLHGPGQDIQLTGRAGDDNNPIHLWTGTSTSPIAVELTGEEQLRRPDRPGADPLEHEDVRVPSDPPDREAG